MLCTACASPASPPHFPPSHTHHLRASATSGCCYPTSSSCCCGPPCGRRRCCRSSAASWAGEGATTPPALEPDACPLLVYAPASVPACNPLNRLPQGARPPAPHPHLCMSPSSRLFLHTPQEQPARRRQGALRRAPEELAGGRPFLGSRKLLTCLHNTPRSCYNVAHPFDLLLGRVTYSQRSFPTFWVRSFPLSIPFAQGAFQSCEKLLRTPLPLSYSRHTSRFLVTWLTALPFCSWQVVGWCAPGERLVKRVLGWGIWRRAARSQQLYRVHTQERRQHPDQASKAIHNFLMCSTILRRATVPVDLILVGAAAVWRPMFGSWLTP
jgi:hypothetical protein